MPQITIGAKEKWQPYLGDLSITISVRYHTHTPKHKTHTRPCEINTKRKKIKKVEDVKVKKKKKREARGIMVLKYLTFFSSFQEELA